MHCPDYFFNCSFYLKPPASLCNQLVAMVGSDVDPQHLIVPDIADDLDHSLGGSEDLRLPNHRNRKMPNLDVVAALSGLRFSQSHTCDLRLAVSAAGNMVVIQRLWVFARYRLDRD